MQGAEERRLRRMEQYAARRSERLPAWREDNAADDVLMVIRREIACIREGEFLI
jgi:hypothetical protein